LFCLLVVIMDLVLLGVMVYYTSWLFMLGFAFISGIVGGWLLNNGLRQYVSKTENSMNASGISGEAFLLGAASRLAAGVLFIVPGILTDLMAILLISPAGKRLVRILVISLFGRMFSSHSNQDQFARSFDDKPVKDQIIDVKITKTDEKEPENGR